MGRKNREKDRKRIEKNEKKQNLETVVSPETKEKNEKKQNLETVASPETKEKKCEKTELKVADFLNILTRKNLKELSGEYRLLCIKHDTFLERYSDLEPYQYFKTGEIPRLNYLIKGFSSISKAKMEASTVAMKKDKPNKLSTPKKKNIVRSPDKTDSEYEVNKEVTVEAPTGAVKKFKSYTKLTPKKKNVVCSPEKTDKEYEVDQEVTLEASTGAVRKGKSNKLSTPKKKNVPFSDNISEMDKEIIKKLHDNNLHYFTIGIHYYGVGFNKYRYDQIPSVHESRSILEFSRPNRTLQETMMSLKIYEESMIYEDIKDNPIRILSFAMKDFTDWVRVYLTIPEVYKYDQTKNLELRLTETFITFYADDLDGKSYEFGMYNLFNKVVPGESEYRISGPDTVVIYAKKKKPELWKKVFAIRNRTKNHWQKEMDSAIPKLTQITKKQMESKEFIWNVSVILANCGTDFLNLPPDLNHANKRFNTLEEVIFFYTEMIKSNSNLKAPIYILGGALLKKLMKSTTLCKSPIKSPTKSQEKNLLQSINITKSQWQKNFIKGHRLLNSHCEADYKQIHYEAAYSFFCDAVKCYNFPDAHLMRGFCLYNMKRYKESLIDYIFVIRNFGPYTGYEAFVRCLNYKSISGYVITAIDQSISLEYNHKEINQTNILILRYLRKTGMNFLKNIFKSHSFIFHKKFKEAIPFLENAESGVLIKSGHTSVILLLLYFLCKHYGKVIPLGNRILQDYTIYSNLVNYLLGMSSYYIKNLAEAVNYLKRVQICVLHDLNRIEYIRRLVYEADDRFQKRLDVDYHYETVLKLAYDNDKLQAYALTKLSALSYWKKDNAKSAEYLTRCIKIVGKTKDLLVVRSVIYKLSGMIDEAKRDYRAYKKIFLADNIY